MEQAITQVEATPAEATNEGTGGKSFSQSDLDALAGKVRSEEKGKRDAAIQDAVESAIKEYERKAKLTQDEKDKETQTKRDAEIRARENDVTMRERTIEAKDMLIKKGISSELAGFVIDLDADRTKENIELLVSKFNEAVEAGITHKLKGSPPDDPSGKTPEKRPIPRYT